MKNIFYIISMCGLLLMNSDIFAKDKVMPATKVITLAEQGNAQAQYYLGTAYLQNDDLKNAEIWIDKSVQQNYTPAQRMKMFLIGRDKPKELIFWLEKASKQNDETAQFLLAGLYNTNEDVKDKEKAKYWYKQAIENGETFYSPLYLSKILMDEYANDLDRTKYLQMKEYMKLAREEGNNLALFHALGHMSTLYGDDVQAQMLPPLIKSAEQGNATHQYSLASLHEFGFWVDKDMDKAFELYRLSAQQNEKRAQFHLARFYVQGRVVEKDIQQGKYWYQKSCEQQLKQACKELNELKEQELVDEIILPKKE